MTAYAEFRLRIEHGASRRTYRVEASGVAGEAEGRFRVPFTATELEIFILKVGRTRRGVRRIESPEMQLAKSFGGDLFSAVMDGKIGELYRAALTEARAAGKGLRVTLSLTDVPELGGIPWEYLYDSPDFLSISTWTPVVRYLDLPKPRRALGVHLPLRILGVVSSPSDALVLDSGIERSKLEAALKPLIDSGFVLIDWLEDANLLALARKLRPDTYHILHYIGHGGFDDTSGEGALLFEDEAGRGRAVSGDQLGTILHDKQSLRLVVLNSCEGARSSVSDPFSGVAAGLVQREIPAVIGMQFEITDRAAVLFAGEFYSMLAQGESVDSAITEARLAIYADHNDVEWGTPVLFMRVADGQLFDIADASAVQRTRPVDLPPKTEAPAAEEVVPVALAGAAGTAELADVGEAPVAPVRATTPAPIAPPTPIEVPIVPPAPSAPVEASALPRRSRSVPRLPLVAFGVAAVALFLLGARALLPTGSTGAIRVDSNGARETGLILVSGRDFAPGEIVDIRVDNDLRAAPTAAADGTFSTPVDIRPKVSGHVEAKGESSTRQASAEFAFATFPPASHTPPALSPSASDSPSPPGSESPPLNPADRCVMPKPTSILFYGNVETGATAADNELYAVDPDTEQVDQLTSNDVEDTFPTWSPDHQRVAFAQTSANGDRDIVICEHDGSVTPLETEATDDWFPTWSKDNWIAFVRSTVNKTTSVETSSIWKIKSDGSQRELVLANSRQWPLLKGPAWSPDGKTLALFGGIATDYDLIFITSQATRTYSVDKVSELNPAWSPDGSTIAFVRDVGLKGRSNHDIYLLSFPKLTLGKQLTTVTLQDGNPVWSSNGKRIAFYRPANRGFHIFRMNVDGTGVEDLMGVREGNNMDPNWR